MDISKKHLLADAIRRTFAQRIEDVSEVKKIAEAAFVVWQQLASQIEPVIGLHGTQVLFNRALHIVSLEFPGLSFAEHELSAPESLMAGFIKHFESGEAQLAIDASEKLLITFSELLSALIGESLTHQLFNPVLVISITKESSNER